MKIALCAAMLLLPTLSSPAFADTLIETSPNAWRLQDYVGGQMNVYYTGSPCTYGLLVMAGTSDENNRFWSMIMSAKIAGKFVGVYYNPTDGCTVTSFYLKEQ